MPDPAATPTATPSMEANLHDLTSRHTDEFASRMNAAYDTANGNSAPKASEPAPASNGQNGNGQTPTDPEPSDPAATPNADPAKGEKEAQARKKWGQLQQESKELAKLKEELPKLREFEKIANDWNETRRQKAEQDAEFRALYDHRNTSDYLDNVERPIVEKERKIDEFCEYSGVSKDALIKVMAEPNEFKRNAALKTVLDAATTELDAPTQTLVASTLKEIRDLALKRADMDRVAAERQRADQANRQQASERQQQERQRLIREAAETNMEIFGKDFPDLLKNEAAAASIRSAEMGDKPEDIAFGAQAAQALVHYSAEKKRLEARVAELEKTLASRNKSMPGVTPTPSNGNEPAPYKPGTKDTFGERMMAAAKPG